jgi:glycosyltransferase involved in cell wall biosynthesis
MEPGFVGTNTGGSLTDQDRILRKPRILFIGLPYSSHTHSWINLLESSEDFNVRLFSTTSGFPPADWWVPTYVLSNPETKNPSSLNIHLYPELERRLVGRKKFLFSVFWLAVRGFRKTANLVGKLLDIPPLGLEVFSSGEQEAFQAWQISIARQLPYDSNLQDLYASYWLAAVIREWQPDIIHTLGLFDNQGGEFYFNVRKEYRLEGIGKWVCQVRGGPDLALYHLLDDRREIIRQIMQECDSFIADNQLNYNYAVDLGLEPRKVSSLGPVPGTGGIDIETLAKFGKNPPSKRERIILWPKAYECPQSKALPVLEAIKMAWSRMQPCKVVMTAVTPEVEMWARSLPGDILSHLELHSRIDRTQLLERMGGARVVLMPSLSDGIPNTLYEAMATGAFPILSPLPTITPLVREKENVLFARNLYPVEIANALIQAMNDDRMLDQAVENNRKLVWKYADRERIRSQVVSYYNVSSI